MEKKRFKTTYKRNIMMKLCKPLSKLFAWEEMEQVCKQYNIKPLSKLFVKKRIQRICKQYNITNYSINEDGSIDVPGDVNLAGLELKALPLSFRIVGGNFDCSNNQLTDLKGIPKMIGGDFNCSRNKLTTLDGGLETVGGSCVCHYNQLTTLKKAPKKIGKDFYCSRNKLTTLDGELETVGGNIYWGENLLILPYITTSLDVGGEILSITKIRT